MLHKRTAKDDIDEEIRPLYGRRVMDDPIPRFEIPDGEMGAAAAYQLIHDELLLDGNPVLNLASFVTTWMEPEAKLLMDEAISKNFIDQEEYPVTSVLERPTCTTPTPPVTRPSAPPPSARRRPSTSAGWP